VRTIGGGGGVWKRFQEIMDINYKNSGTTGIQVRTALNGEEHGTSRKIKYTILEAFDLGPEL